MAVPRKKKPKRRAKPSVTVDDFRDDPMYPRVVRATAHLLAKGKVVAPVDVLVHMGVLQPKRLEEWRRGSVPYLERVIDKNLSSLSRLLRILRFHAHDMNLQPSLTAYTRSGKGPKQPLRFTKTGDPQLERAYATHLVWPGKGPFHAPRSQSEGEAGRGERSEGALDDEG